MNCCFEKVRSTRFSMAGASGVWPSNQERDIFVMDVQFWNVGMQLENSFMLVK
jgi:hypothetical protein